MRSNRRSRTASRKLSTKTATLVTVLVVTVSGFLSILQTIAALFLIDPYLIAALIVLVIALLSAFAFYIALKVQ
jgi:uncharacterized protein YqhQ